MPPKIVLFSEENARHQIFCTFHGIRHLCTSAGISASRQLDFDQSRRMLYPSAPDPVELVIDLGGVVRTPRLRTLGVTRRSLDAAIAEGRLLRVRRGWVASRDADPALIAAARTGVVISCVSQAARLSLWVHELPEKFHVGADPHSARGKSERAHVHWSKPLIPRSPDDLVDPIENVLALVADCESFERALATWESALNKGLVTLSGLAGYSWKPAASELLARANPFADAGTETYLRERLKWLGLRMLVQTSLAGHKVDLLLGDRLVLQVDGKHHVGAQRSEDIRHDAELKLMGYHVIRVSYQQLMHEWPMVQDLIMRAVAQGLHLAL